MTVDRSALARQYGMKLADELLHWIKSSDSRLLETPDGAPLRWELVVLAAAASLTGKPAQASASDSERDALARNRGRQLAEDLVAWVHAEAQRGMLTKEGTPLDADEVVRGTTDYLAYQARKTPLPEPPPWAAGNQPS